MYMYMYTCELYIYIHVILSSDSIYIFEWYSKYSDTISPL